MQQVVVVGIVVVVVVVVFVRIVIASFAIPKSDTVS
jgi:hypothetical protein